MPPFELVTLVKTESFDLQSIDVFRHCPTEHSDARNPESVTTSSSQLLVTSRALPVSLQKSANPVARGPAFSTSGLTGKRSRTSVPSRDQQTWTDKPLTLDPITRLEHPPIKSHRTLSKGHIPSFIDSPGMVLDNLVVNSFVTYSSLAHKSGSTKLHEWCNSILPVFRDLEEYKDFLNYRGERAQTTIDSLQGSLDDDVVDQQCRVTVAVALSRLARKSELFPTRFFLHDVTRLEGTIAEGHFGAIQRGLFDGKDVCIKIVRLKSSDARLYRRALSREIMAWAQISHENILPFYGICSLGDSVRFGIVAPFLKSGNVVDFLAEFPDADRRSLIRGIATGMSHLHDNGIVHGDIKGPNILVTDTDPPRAVLADFGLAAVVDTEGLKSPLLSSNAIEGGTRPFEAPELLDPDIDYRRTTASDVYAFSMTVYEILSGEVPFYNKHKNHVPTMVLRGARPSRPAGQVYRDRGLDDFMWELMNDCWHQEAAQRPSAKKVLERLSNVVPAPRTQGWGDLSPSWFRNKQNS